MPYITPGGSIYYGHKQAKSHKKISEPPDNISNYDKTAKKWVEDTEKKQKIENEEKKAMISKPFRCSLGFNVVCRDRFYFTLTAILNKAKREGVKNTSIIDADNVKRTVSVKELEGLKIEIENRIVGIING